MSVTSVIATTGMLAATTRLNVAASNIANIRTTGPLPGSPSFGNPAFPSVYEALIVNQVDGSGAGPAGTIARVSTARPTFVPQSDPSAPFADADGMVAAPNVDLSNELTQVLLAQQSFSLNTKVFQADDEMSKTLIDMQV